MDGGEDVSVVVPLMGDEESGEGASASEILTELRLVREDISGLASHTDLLFVAASVLLLVGVVIGAVAAACARGWTR